MKNITLSTFALLLTLSSTYASTLNEKPTTNSLVVYNSNIGLVHEERKLSLDTKDSFILYEDVASSIDTDSVNVKLPSGVTLYSQQYRYDKLTRAKLLEAFIGKEVMVAKDKVTLLSSSGISCIIKTADNLIKSVNASDVIFDSIPKALITKPSLVWNIKSEKVHDNSTMDLDYLIKNISWKSNYVLNLKGDSASLSGWISVKNSSGKAFKDTNLYLLAGGINRIQNNRVRPQLRAVKMMMADSAAVREQAHEGYHFYTVPFKVNLANKETSQIKFMSEKLHDISRKYSAVLSNPLYLRGKSERGVSQFLSFKGLDKPLPEGVVRTYSKLQNTSILLGESAIKHTPKNTPMNLRLGENFDLKVTQTVLKREDTKREFDVDVKYTIKNASDTNKDVTLLIPFNKHKYSSIDTKQNYKFTKGNMATFTLEVKANATKSFRVNFESKK